MKKGFFILFFSFSIYPNAFQVKEMGKSLEVYSPQCGKKILEFDPSVNSQGNYRFEVPIETLCPKKDESDREPDSVLPKTTEKIEVKEIVVEKAKEEPKKEEPEEEEAKVAEVPKLPPIDRRSEYVTTANHNYLKGKLFEAKSTLEQCVNEYPQYLLCFKMYGSVLYKLGRIDLAHEAWKKGLEIAQNDNEKSELSSILQRYK